MSGRSTKGLGLFVLAPLIPAGYAGMAIASWPGAAVCVVVGLGTGFGLWWEWSAPLALPTNQTRGDRLGWWTSAQRWLTVLVLLLIGCAAALGALDRFLHALHMPGLASYGLDVGLGLITSPDARRAQITDALELWRNASQSQPVRADIGDFIFAWGGAIQAYISTPVGVLFLALLATVARHLVQMDWRTITQATDPGLSRRRLVTASTPLWQPVKPAARRQELADAFLLRDVAYRVVPRQGAVTQSGAASRVQPNPRASAVLRYLLWGKWVTVALLLLVVVAWLQVGWQRWLGADATQLLVAWLLSGAVWAQWSIYVLVLFYLASVLVLWLRHSRGPQAAWEPVGRLLATLTAVRLPLVMVAVFGFGLSLTNQIPDTLRRWIPGPEQPIVPIVIGVALTLLLSAVTGLGTWWLLVIPFRVPAPARVRLWPFAAALLLYVVAWLAFGAIAPQTENTASPFSSWKPLFPILIVLGILVLSVPFIGWPALRPAKPLGVSAVPWVLASAFPVFLSSALIGNGLEVLLYDWWHRASPGPALWLPIEAGLTLLGGVLLLRRLAQTASVSFPTGRRKLAWVVSHSTATSWTCLLAAVSIWFLIDATISSSPEQLQIVGQSIGTIGWIALALLLVMVASVGLVGLANALFPTPPVYRLLGYRHVPVLSLVLIWWLLAGALPPEEATHNARIIHPSGVAQARSGESILGDFEQWLVRQCPIAAQSGAAEPGVIPLIIVASAGGGSRAATWTTYVMDATFHYGVPNTACGAADRPRAADSIFAMTGISGGSVGLATYAARQGAYDAAVGAGLVTPPNNLPRPDVELSPDSGVNSGSGWIRQQLGVDGVAPTIAWMLFAETPWSLLRFPLGKDRAAVLEQTWEQFWWPRMPANPGQPGPDQPPRFFDLRQRAKTLPLMVFNGTSVESGCRLNASVLELGGHARTESTQRCLAPQSSSIRPDGFLGTTIDLVDFLCANDDLPLSTAALLSARWPYISPSGRIEQCARGSPDPGGPATPRTPPPPLPPAVPRTYAVDGGYHEGSGAATAMDLWSAIAPLVYAHNAANAAGPYIVPFAIQIDNGYDEAAGPSPAPVQNQFLVPLLTFGVAGGTASERTRQQLELVFDKPFPVGADRLACYSTRYAHFDLHAHPGPEATVGWSLSNVSFDDMVQQFGSPQGQLPTNTVRSWFERPRTSLAGTACTG